MKTLLAALLVFALGSIVCAQEIPPALFADVGAPDAEAPKLEPLQVARVEAEARIVGLLAETRLTLTFANPHDRALSGDFYFPLPEGATVSGYALDIEGTMVDGVVVERQKGRQIFEAIVRQGIDPGLVEWVKGSNFKTRVFPIPPRGSRTVMVKYLSEVVDGPEGPAYYMPLNFRDPVGEFRLRVQVVKAAVAPVVQRGGPPELRFGPWEDGYVAEAELTNAALTDDLVVGLPDVKKQNVLVEQGPDGDCRFCLYDFPPLPALPPKTSPSRVRILWDASGSRGKVDHTKEIELLKAYFAELKGADVAVDLVVFRNAPAPAQHLVVKGGDCAALVAEIDKVQYDGGTCLDGLAGEDEPDVYLLFTDGNRNFGVGALPSFARPVYAISADSTADHPFLRHMARGTGGDYVNLSRLDVLRAVAVMRQARFALLSVRAGAGELADTYPQDNEPVSGRVNVVGKLLADAAEVVLTYGINGEPTHTARYTVSRDEAVEGDLLARSWAQARLQDLQADPDRNADEILALGRKYGLVTPGTSLIVLDSLEQYLEHRIAPPRSLPAMRAEYEELVAEQARDEAEEKEQKLEEMLEFWQEKVDWWNRAFTYEPGFKYTEPPEDADDEDADGTLRGRISALFSMPAGAPAEALQAAPEIAGLAAGDVTLGMQLREAPAEAPDIMGAPAIMIKRWDPETPYLTALKEAAPEEAFAVYMRQRVEYADSPAFFLDCADFFFKGTRPKLGMQVLSNVAEMELESAPLLRVLGHKLAQLDELDLSVAVFEEVLKMRPDEPQSYRDLGLVLARRAGEMATADREADYARAVELLWQVVTGIWDRFEEIELIALVELNRLIPLARAAGVEEIPVDARFTQLMDVDVRIILTWDADLTDIDLWVIEPSGEKAFYGHNLTTIGGHMSEDFTDGYGPEEYLVRKAMTGSYKIQANYFGSSAVELTGAVTVQADVFTNYGRPNERRRSLTLQLKTEDETVTVGEIEF